MQLPLASKAVVPNIAGLAVFCIPCSDSPLFHYRTPVRAQIVTYREKVVHVFLQIVYSELITPLSLAQNILLDYN